jgi:hypothetical protein
MNYKDRSQIFGLKVKVHLVLRIPDNSVYELYVYNILKIKTGKCSNIYLNSHNNPAIINIKHFM